MRNGSEGPGSWKKLAEVPAAAFAGEPTGHDYSWLDESAAGGGRYEYRIQEIDNTGQRGSGCSAEITAVRTGPGPRPEDRVPPASGSRPGPTAASASAPGTVTAEE